MIQLIKNPNFITIIEGSRTEDVPKNDLIIEQNLGKVRIKNKFGAIYNRFTSFQDYTLDGVTATSLDQLITWLRTNFFKDASQGGGGTEYTFSNGLTEEDGEVKLGGQLTDQFTIIGRNSPLDGSAFNGIWFAPGQNWIAAANPNNADENFRIVNAYNSGFFQLNGLTHTSLINWLPDNLSFSTTNTTNGRENSIGLDENKITIRSTIGSMEYESDYRSRFTNRSLVDKEYVDKSLLSMVTGVNRVYSNDPDLFEFNQTGYYTHNGDEDLIKVLPDVSISAGTRYVILNTTGLGNLEIQGNIFESGIVITSFNVSPGENYIIYSNGQHWVIV